MLTEGCEVKRPGLRTTVHFPSIRVILERFQATKASGKRVIRKFGIGNLRFFVMAISTPREVPTDLASDLINQIHEKNLMRRWEDAGYLVRPEDGVPAAPLKLSLSHMRETWGTYCVVAVAENGDTRGSCWYCCRTGHCTHEYVAQQLSNIQTHIRGQVPLARVGAIALRRRDRAGSSGDEGALAVRPGAHQRQTSKPRLRGIRRKRQPASKPAAKRGPPWYSLGHFSF